MPSYALLLPYYKIPDVHLGPLTLHPFGMLVAAAVLLGYFLARKRAKAVGLDDLTLTGTVNWLLVAGFIGAHLVAVFAYHPEELRQDPWVILKVWAGLSSFGGFVGAVIGALLSLWRRRVPILPYLDAIAFALAPAWAVGRLGCTVAFDHPGRLTTSFLGMPYPGGGVRFNLGLLEVPLALGIAAVLWYLSRRERAPGTYLGAMSVLYGAGRFFLDFLRATDLAFVDPRYLGLTPAQWGCIALVVVGGVLLWRSAHRPLATRRVEHDGESLGPEQIEA